MSIKERAIKLDSILFDFFNYQWQQKNDFSELFNLNIKEVLIINILGLKNISATMTELAELFKIPATTITSIIDRLVKKKYLKRFRTEEDRRIVKVTLSKEGKEFYNELYNYSLEAKISLLNKLSEKEQEEFILLLDKIMSH